MTTITSNPFDVTVVVVSPDLGYPRIAAYAVGGGVYTPTNSDGVTLAERIATLAKCHIVVWGGWRGWSYDGEDMQSICGTIKAASTLPNDPIIVKYVGVPTYLSLGDGPDNKHPRLKILQETGPNGTDWALRDTVGGNTAIQGFSTSFLINHSEYVTSDANGYTMPTWRGLFITADDGDSTEDWARAVDGESYNIGFGIKPDYDWDGVWFDNPSWYGFTMQFGDPDIDQDGTPDVQHSDKYIAMQAKWTYECSAAIRSRYPEFIIGGNNGANTNSGKGWDVHGVPPANGKIFPVSMRDDFNIISQEFHMGVTWSEETWGTWNGIMRNYKNGIFFSTRDNSYCTFGHGSQALGSDNGARPTSHTVTEWVRYGLCSCLQDDGYFTPSATHSYASEVRIDEMDYDLGQAISSPDYDASPSVSESGYNAKTDGIYWREFDNGIAIVNPKDNGNKTNVSLPSAGNGKVWKTFAGSTVTTFDLEQRSGLILKRVAA